LIEIEILSLISDEQDQPCTVFQEST